MKPENIEADKRRKKKSAVISVGAFALLQVGTAIAFGALCLLPGIPPWLFTLFFVLAILPLALLIPALLVLKQRFFEIERGEQYEARQY